MKVTIEADEVAEIVRNVFKVDGFKAIEARAKYPGGDVEVIFEKSPVDQGLVGGASGNKLARRPPPTPSTPPASITDQEMPPFIADPL